MTVTTELVGGPLDGDRLDLDSIIQAVDGVALCDFNWVDLFWVDARVYVRYVVTFWRGRLVLLYEGTVEA
jgi:hypothetical protein